MGHVSANTVQQSFRGRNDDGSESAASWIAATNTNWSQNVDETFRVRFLTQETAGGSANNLNLIVQFNLNSGGWTTVGASTAVQFASSGTVSDGTATTAQIGAGSFVTGEFDSNGTITAISLSNDETETEYCLTIDSAQVADSDSIQLRVTDGGSALNGYTNTPTVTVVEATPDALLADDIESASSVTSPSIGQTHALTANDVEGSGEVTSPALGQEHVLTANSVSSTSELSSPSLSESHSLLADDIEAITEVSAPSVGQNHALLADDLSAQSEVASPSVGQVHSLAQNGLQSVTEVSNPALSEATSTDDLLAEDIESASSVDSPNLGQVHALNAASVSSLSELSTPNLGQAGTIALNAVSIESSAELTRPTLSVDKYVKTDLGWQYQRQRHIQDDDEVIAIVSAFLEII